MANGHAKLSPSSAARWMRCPGSVALSQAFPDTSSEHADEGTAAHAVAERALQTGKPAAFFIGTEIILTPMKKIPVTAEMAEQVQKYVDYVRSIGGQLMVEQHLSIEHLTGEAGAAGTSDSVILTDEELVIVDLKYGRGVKVDAEANEQLQIYALAALREFEFLGDFKRVRLVIHQPRLDHVSEWDMTVDELRGFGAMVKTCAADTEKADATLTPGEKQCRWCKAKATCPALAAKVQESVGAEFEVLTSSDCPPAEQAVSVMADRTPDRLPLAMQAVDLIEDWCKAVRAEVERRLLQGVPVAGYKLVEGRRGSRKWGDAAEVETVLKAMRLKTEEMYDFTLISPTTAEKLHKAGTIGPRQWPKLQGLITQSEGRPSVAPASDKRPAVVVEATAAEFANVTEAVGDLV